MSETCLVFFEAGRADLASAERELKSLGMTVAKDGEYLIATRPNAPTFRICLSAETWVREEAEEIGHNTKYADRMLACNARFEVYIDDLDAALEEINTLMEIQGALQDVSKGVLFLSWNGTLMEPYSG